MQVRKGNSLATAITDRLRWHRLNRGFTQAEMAERAGISVHTYCHAERTGNISLDRFCRVLEAMGMRNDLEMLLPLNQSVDLFSVQPEEKRRQRGSRVR